MKINKINFILGVIALCVGFVSCSSDDDGDETPSFSMSQIVGSEWKTSYYVVDDGDGSYERGNSTLTFKSSSHAEIVSEYSGKEWIWDGYDQFKYYSGTRTVFYSYTKSGNNIKLQNKENEYDIIDLTLSGNKLISSSSTTPWTISKVGDGNSNAGDTGYSVSNLQGIWMESDAYNADLSIFAIYEQQNAYSSTYLNNEWYGDFGVEGILIEASGAYKWLYVCCKIWKSNIVLKTIYAKDKTVYWTDIENGKYQDNKMIVSGNKVYIGGKETYEIRSAKTLYEIDTNKYFDKVQ